MAKFPFLIDSKRLFFYGCGGVSMSALAKYFLLKGEKVYGYDDNKSTAVLDLERLGLKFLPPERLTSKSFLIVYTSAVEKTDGFNWLKDNGFTLVKRSELLCAVQKLHKINFSVSGCHGKTTSTAMLAHVLTSAGKHPTAFIGGDDEKFGNLLFGKRSFCIAEACEFKANFLDMTGNVAVILNIDDDHLDSYGSMTNLKKAFSRFAQNKIAVVNADDENLKTIQGKKTITFGIKNEATFTAKDIVLNDKTEFSVYEKGKFRERIILNVKGKHNVYNALSVIAAARVYGVDYKKIKHGLESFTGVKRRSEVVGEINGKTAVCDYAHHPTEIRALLSTVDLDTTAIIFQPHTYSRTALLLNSFTETLKDCKNLIIYKTYAAREKFDKCGSARTLYLSVVAKSRNRVNYADTPRKLSAVIDGLEGIKSFLFIGAGDIYEIAINLTDKK